MVGLSLLWTNNMIYCTHIFSTVVTTVQQPDTSLSTALQQPDTTLSTALQQPDTSLPTALGQPDTSSLYYAIPGNEVNMLPL